VWETWEWGRLGSRGRGETWELMSEGGSMGGERSGVR